VLSLGGGTNQGLEFSATNYNGYPALKVVGESDGQPIGLVASSVSGAESTIDVQQVQAGSNGADYVFTLAWPNIPTLGTWAIAADGKRPVVLPYNATSEQLRAALLSFDIPCRSISVTGDHAAGYRVRLIEPTAQISTPPVLFPIVPIGGQLAIVEITLLESFSYRFGPDSLAYQTEGVFEASITDSEMKAYLSRSVVLGSLASDVTVSSQKIEPVSDFTAGVVFRFEFSSKAAFDAFMQISKVRLNYTWTSMGVQSTATGFIRFQNIDIPGALSWLKVRQYTTPKNGSTGTYNPFNRSFHTKAWLGATPNATFVLNNAVAGYESSMVQARPHTIQWMGLNQWRVEVSSSWTASGESWNLVPGEITVSLGVQTSTSPLELSVISDGSGDELGVNNNAGYTVETVGTPGIINQEIVLSSLDGDLQSLYQFESSGKRSHRFTGASTLELVRDAAESLWGKGNVVVSREAQDSFLRIAFVGKLSERLVEANLYRLGDTSSTSDEVRVDIEASTPMKAWVLRYRFTGGVCSGRWGFASDNSKNLGSLTRFNWLSPSDVTPEAILSAINEISGDYQNVLVASDISVINEDVGRKTVLREFTITFQAQPSAPFAGPDSVVFWLGLDTKELKTAEPSLSIETSGQTSQSEIQVVALSNGPKSGSWQLKYGSKLTALIPWNASSIAVQNALQGIGVLASVLGGNGGPYRVRWNADGSRQKLQGINLNLANTLTPSFETVVLQVGTGPKHFDNPENWSLQRVPIAGDRVVFADGQEDCCYLLEVTEAIEGIDVYRSYSGRIGLPEIRDDGSIETLPLWLTVTNSSAVPLVVRVGLGESAEGPTVLRLCVQGRPYDACVLYSQSGLSQKVVAFKGDHQASKLVGIHGDIALGIRPEDVANCSSVSITPSPSAGDSLFFSSGANSKIDSFLMLGGSASLGSPPRKVAMRGGLASILGSGNCEELDISGASVRWLADGTVGKSQTATGMLFGSALESIAYAPTSLRVESPGHGLVSGTRVYLRAYSGVVGIDGKVFSVQVVDANRFDLVACSAFGTYVGYEGLIAWGTERAVLVRDNGILDFDSDGRTRDIVAPIVLQGTGKVTDSKASIKDLRLWPELVEAFDGLGVSIELRRIAR
jgi:hypothetical protein